MFKCKTCGKSYKREGMLKRHSSLCTFLNQTPTVLENDLETIENGLPSQLEMYYTMCELTKKCMRLEEKVQKLERLAKPVKKEKQTGVEWLTENVNMVLSLKQYLNNIYIEDKIVLDYLYGNSITELFEYVLLPKFKIMDDIPMRYNNNIVYYLNDELKWDILTHNDFIDCIKVFENNLVRLLNQDKDRLIQNETYTDIMMKLVVIDKSVYSQLKKVLCKQVTFDY